MQKLGRIQYKGDAQSLLEQGNSKYNLVVPEAALNLDTPDYHNLLQL